MKKLVTNKYFLIIWAIIVAVFNACLFIITSSFNKEVLSKASFWVIYGFVMASFLMILVARLLYNHNEKNIDAFPIFVLPTLLFIIIIGIILFLFAGKMNRVVWPLVIFIILFGFVAIGVVLALLAQNSLKNVPVKEVEVIDYVGLTSYLTNLLNTASNDVIKGTLNKLLSIVANVVENDNDSCKALDKRIFEKALFLKKDLNAGSVNNFVMNAEGMEKLLKQRIELN